MQKRIDAIWEEFCVIFPALRDFKQPTVIMNARLKTTAGRCFYDKNLIDLNVKLFAENTEAFFLDTIPHEMAHQISFNLYGNAGRGHNNYWRHVMLSYGIKPSRCHDYIITK